ncbi:hypothetical protein GQ55_2G135600 [Panicum hallii var. hallii]|uniref:RecA family profile 1 domain-containing protein n=1 Tax=Panicum hallii var. hallii TaxID=1504633 RepID=A0A2T7EPH2_9POAL|nr:hypothetical protein GQ55_2G135600 [Panicum hallii var. hallii]PUZ69738.1 hypothetical protein GQ55_2G135600 [Panicum hallii var. hallii]
MESLTYLVKEPKDARLKSVMRSIICESVFDIFALFEVLHQLEVSLLNDKVNNGGSKVCLLVIDSISSLLAPIIGGKYPQGRSMMISVAVILKKLADEHNLSVLRTFNLFRMPSSNNSYRMPSSNKVVFGIHLVTQHVTNHMVSAGNGAVKPALGESWKAVPHVRLMLSHECQNNICTATVLKHTLMASGRTAKFAAPS